MRLRALLLFSTLAACAVVASAGGAAASGLYGLVTRSPTMPVCRAEQPCSAPAKHVTLVFLRNDEVVARATTDDKGRYRIRLRPGSYAVRLAKRPAIGKGLEPKRARVPADRLARVNFSIDTGIR